ncbi:hypothetical protein BDQ94DRAFT_139551 [Aspergillus welwitschiae]|uniref:Uncharacterized protein n=1 Tax=Aspergillus welwitschiae TaxID=1341132 RepID=A0A3F3Q9D6_9EURO|nr:hypothetical protein BDQ94DRAFT_139551 [Aspergillus welwitschiae]RDH35356.1 hypothetical protein BDQ94DRAFT_139551 [Aspergillus welwitschiae]
MFFIFYDFFVVYVYMICLVCVVGFFEALVEMFVSLSWGGLSQCISRDKASSDIHVPIPYGAVVSRL